MLCLFIERSNLTKVITTGREDLFSESTGGKLRLQVLVLVVDAGQALAVKHAVVTAVVDPGAVLHTHYVSSLITRFGESGEGEESSGHSIRRQLMGGGALEAHHTLCLLVTVGNIIWVVAHMLLH